MHRILVIANETADTDLLHEVVRAAADRPNAAVLVVAPAAEREEATRRVVRCVGALAAVGVDAHGMIGDRDPLRTTIEALRLFPADEIVVATYPESLVARIARDFDGPIKHVVVGPECEPAAA